MNETPIAVTGNLTDDPELRFAPTGTPVAKLRAAANPVASTARAANG